MITLKTINSKHVVTVNGKETRFFSLRTAITYAKANAIIKRFC